jgi:predicted amidohydrolase
MICFDWRFPEVARGLALRGCEILCHPSNLVMDICPAAMVTRALENRIHCCTADRWGADTRPEGRIDFVGASQIVDAAGKVVARPPAGGDGFAVADLDPAQARDKRVTPRNDLLRDRRPQLYGLDGGAGS